MARPPRGPRRPRSRLGGGPAVRTSGPDQSPTEESATFKRVRQARRHGLWRLAHPFHPDVAIRIIVWFPDADTVVIALVGFDKARHGDVWCTSAAVRAEAMVDQWLREQRRT